MIKSLLPPRLLLHLVHPLVSSSQSTPPTDPNKGMYPRSYLALCLHSTLTSLCGHSKRTLNLLQDLQGISFSVSFSLSIFCWYCGTIWQPRALLNKLNLTTTTKKKSQGKLALIDVPLKTHTECPLSQRTLSKCQKPCWIFASLHFSSNIHVLYAVGYIWTGLII